MLLTPLGSHPSGLTFFAAQATGHDLRLGVELFAVGVQLGSQAHTRVHPTGGATVLTGALHRVTCKNMDSKTRRAVPLMPQKVTMGFMSINSFALSRQRCTGVGIPDEAVQNTLLGTKTSGSCNPASTPSSPSACSPQMGDLCSCQSCNCHLCDNMQQWHVYYEPCCILRGAWHVVANDGGRVLPIIPAPNRPGCRLLTCGSLMTPGCLSYQARVRPMFGCTTLMPAWAAAAPCTKLQQPTTNTHTPGRHHCQKDCSTVRARAFAWLLAASR